MLPFRSIWRLSSPSLSKFSTQRNRLFTNPTCQKPFPTAFLRHLASTTDRSQKEAYSGAASVDEIAKGIVHLQCESSAEGGVSNVYLVGTCHASQESCKEVKAVISYLKPQAVFLELCQGRAGVLTDQNFEVPTVGEMFNVWKNNKVNPFFIWHSWFLAKTARELEASPGAELGLHIRRPEVMELMFILGTVLFM